MVVPARFVSQLSGIRLNTLKRFKSPTVWDCWTTGIWVDDPFEAWKNIHVSSVVSFRDMM